MGRSKAQQGHLLEAEIEMRRALLSRLKAVGKYHPVIANMLRPFADLLISQSRFKEAELLARESIGIFDSLGYRPVSSPYVLSHARLAASLFGQHRYAEAKEVLDTIDLLTEGLPPNRRVTHRSGWHRPLTYYFTGNVDKGLDFAKDNYERRRSTKGNNHYDTALARAAVAMGLAIAGRDLEAMQEFKAAVPLISDARAGGDDEDPTVTLNADRRLRTVLETYLALLSRSNSPDAAEESFRIAEAIRSGSVQNAMGAAAVRASAQTPALAELAPRSGYA